jgi:hypothetical protein
MHRDCVLRSALMMAVALVGCRFNKATEGQINPPPPDTGEDAGGGGPDLRAPDIITMLPPDASLFEAEASVNCIEANPQTKSLPPDVLILLDRSGSMAQKIDGTTCNGTGAGGRGGGAGGRGGGMMGGGIGDCGPDSKWTQMTTALKDFLPIVETTVNWGIMYFGNGSTNSGTDSCTVYSTAQVPPGTMNAGAISTSINATKPATATPTTAAVTAAAKYLAGLDDGNPKFILLATDGLPTCGSGGSSADDTNAIAAVKAAKAMGIPTFVIGIGTAMGGGDATLTSMATEGGFPRAGTPAYYSVTSANDLKDAFSMITGMVGVCYFSVNPVPKSVSDIIDVKGDNNVIPQDSTDGWTFVTMPASSGIQLNGKSCEDYKSGNIKAVLVDLPCIVL